MAPTTNTTTGAFPGPPPSTDVDGKIRLYAAIAAMRNSRLPSNAQVAATIEYINTHPPIDESRLSAEGRKLIGDIKAIMGTFSEVVQEKNKGDLLQRFVWETRGVDVEGVKPVVTDEHREKGKEHLERARSDAQEASQHLRTLLNLLLTNAEMRKLLTDAGTLGRDLLAKGAAKAAGTIAPDAEQLRLADEAAPQDAFHDDDPLAKLSKTKEEKAAKKQAKEEAKAAKIAAKEGDATTSPVIGTGASSTGPTAASTTGVTAGDSTSESSDSEAEVQVGGEVIGADGKKVKVEKKKNTFFSRLTGLHQKHGKPAMESGRAWLADEYFPAERREQWIWRGKKVVMECQRHDDYAPAVKWLLDAVDAWALRARDSASTDGETLLPASTLKEDPALQSALGTLRELLERIAGAPLAPIFDAAKVMARDAKEDEGLRNWWGGVDEYVRKVLLQPGYVVEPACNTRAKELRESGRGFYEDKYKGHFDALGDAVGNWFRSMASDPLNKTFGEDWARLTRDLLFDSEGNLQFKKTLWDDVRGVILPTVADKVGYIPIPRVEYTDDSLDLVVENLTLSGRHLLPNIVEVEAHNYVRFSPYETKSKSDKAKHEVTFTFAQMHADMRDVAFYFRTKTGPIKIKDSGLADVLLGGQGLTATVTLTSSPDSAHVFSVGRVRVSVGSLKFSIRDSKHDLLYKTFKPLATRLIKSQIKKALADAIRTGFEYVDGQLVGVRDRMAEAKGSEEGRRRDVLGDMFKRKKEDTASTVSRASGGGSQFKVVSSKRQSLLPEHGHPDGWVNRADDAKKAEQTNEWRSDAFDINRPLTTPATGANSTPVAAPTTAPAASAGTTATPAATTAATAGTTAPATGTPIAASHGASA
ncbi:hypothetical protein C8R47DRAFT_300002 [Mycena vitilis]|nr:hypothetical protein C8R47DRAFT_300002 [Mycena vitilis]